MNWLTTSITLATARKSPVSIDPPKATLGTNQGVGRSSRKKLGALHPERDHKNIDWFHLLQ